MNTTRDFWQPEAAIHLGGFRSGKHTILSRTSLPDYTTPFSRGDRNKFDFSITTAAITAKSAHA